MYVYSLGQWLLFFFLYCFLGWVWESCYVSAKRRQWVNRGFLHGPMLPIYGTGAVIILLATIPVRDSLLLLCKQAAKIFQTICKKETALKRVLRNLLSAISFAQI